MEFQIGSPIKALVFDTFGTVVDWHGSVAREVDVGAVAPCVLLEALEPRAAPGYARSLRCWVIGRWK